MALARRIDRTARRAMAGVLARTGLLDTALSARDQFRRQRSAVQRVPAAWRHRATLLADAEVLLVRDDRRWQLARRDERLVARDVAADNLALVADAFQAARIPFFVVAGEEEARSRVGVDRTHQRAALHALASLHDATSLLSLPAVRPRGRRRVAALAGRVDRRVRARALRTPVWCVYRNHADPGGRLVLGHAYGCEVEFWATSPGATPGTVELTAPQWNKKADALPRDDVGSAPVRAAGRGLTTAPPFASTCHFDQVAFPVDLVYTWVDGADPRWVERKNALLRAFDLETVSPDSADPSRYASRDELKYSLRSVAMYADFVRRVYVVTDDQVPSWLDTDNPRIRLVSHKEIFSGAGRLPTFNSHAIEARLHHIDGLAEHYLYLNDDFFFCRRLPAEAFFLGNGSSKFYLSSALMGVDEASPKARSVDAAARNSRRLLQRQFGRTTSQKFRHAPYPQRRSVLFEMEEVFADDLARTAGNQIRSPDDIAVPSSFYHYYAYLTGRAVPGSLRAHYVALGRPDFVRRLRDVERRGHADTLCINDTAPEGAADVEDSERALQKFLDRNWPVASEFER